MVHSTGSHWQNLQHPDSWGNNTLVMNHADDQRHELPSDDLIVMLLVTIVRTAISFALELPGTKNPAIVLLLACQEVAVDAET